jgi:hypothetical protein
MMYEANWADDRRTTVYMTFEGVWYTDEFAEAYDTLYDLLSEVGHEVSVVLHMTQPQPIAMNMVPQIRELIAIEHPNRSQMVVVAPGEILAGVREVVRRAFGGNLPAGVFFAPSLDVIDDVLGGVT